MHCPLDKAAWSDVMVLKGCWSSWTSEVKVLPALSQRVAELEGSAVSRVRVLGRFLSFSPFYRMSY